MSDGKALKQERDNGSSIQTFCVLSGKANNFYSLTLRTLCIVQHFSIPLILALLHWVYVSQPHMLVSFSGHFGLIRYVNLFLFASKNYLRLLTFLNFKSHIFAGTTNATL